MHGQALDGDGRQAQAVLAQGRRFRPPGPASSLPSCLISRDLLQSSVNLMRCSPGCCGHCSRREAVARLLLLLRTRDLIPHWCCDGQHRQAAPPAGLPEGCCTGLAGLHGVAAGAQTPLHPRKRQLQCHGG